MKNCLLIFLLFAGLSPILSNAQTVTIQDTAGVDSQRWRDTCFGLLSLSNTNIPSGYLMDYSLSPVIDSGYNSILGATVDTVQNGKFLSLLTILNNAKVNSSAAALPTPDSAFINAYRAKRNTGIIPLMFLFQSYQRINPNGFSTGQFSLSPDSIRISDVPGRSGTPYLNDFCFSFTPFQNDITQYGTISFNAPSSFWLMPGVTSVIIDFSDGIGYRTITPGSTVSINYNTPGSYILSAQIFTTSGNFLAKSVINYNPYALYESADTTINIVVSPVYSSISSYIIAHGGARSRTMDVGDPCTYGGVFTKANCDINPGAKITIQNGCDNYFDKPIIIVEGFDPTGTVQTADLADLITPNAVGSAGFLSTMRGQGYDLVYVVFTKNTDFIENNAKVLEAVIERVNQLKHGSAKNTIIGFSMGGLVARWALRDMENLSLDHQTSNYFSFDSPHQGANISFGLQCLYNQIKQDFPEASWSPDFTELGEGFLSPAAQEMLVLNANATDGTPFVPLRYYFAQDLINLGYPQLTNNMALSLGRGDNPSGTVSSGVGSQFGFSLGTKIFHGGLSYLLKGMSAEAYSEPNYTNGQVLHYKMFGFKPSSIFNLLGSPLQGKTVNYYLAGTPSYDDVTGSYENTQSQFVSSYNGKIWFLHLRGLAPEANNNGHYGHCFVPLASAMDLQNQNYGVLSSYVSTNLYYPIDNIIQNAGQLTGNTLSTPSLSPFSAVLSSTSDCGSVTCQVYTHNDKIKNLGSIPDYVTGPYNDYHEGYLSNQAQLFVQRKILGSSSVTSCSSSLDLCNGVFTVTGPANLCDNITYTYNLTGRINSASVQWSFPNGHLQLVSGQGTPTITVKKVSNGTEVITALLTNSCGFSTYKTLTVYPGGQVPTISILGIAPYANGPMDVNISTSVAGPYKWYVDNVLVSTAYSFTATINGGSCGSHNLRAEVTTECGTVSSSSLFYTRTCSGGHSFLLSPNPASNLLTVQVSPEPIAVGNSADARAAGNGNNIAKGISVITLYSSYGSPLRTWKFGSQTTNTTIDISRYSAGTYTLEISNGTSIERQVFVIVR